jgi:uncharacterized protein YodC (DUF2158 family)
VESSNEFELEEAADIGGTLMMMPAVSADSGVSCHWYLIALYRDNYTAVIMEEDNFWSA